MPYDIEKTSGGFKVKEGESGKRPGHEFSKKPQTKSTALAQLRAIMANKHGKK